MAQLVYLVGLGMLFLSWNTPNHYPPWTSFHGEAAAAVALLLFGVAAGSKAWRSKEFSAIPLPAWGWLLASLVPLLQFSTGMLAFRGDAALGFLYLGGGAIAIAVGHRLAAVLGRDALLRSFFLCLLAASLVSMAIALRQWLGLAPWGWWTMELIDDRPYGNFAQPNLFGLSIVISIIATLWLHETGVLRRRWVALLTIAFLLQGVLISQARASGLALMVLLMLWWMLRRQLNARTSVASLAAIGAFAAALFMAALQFQQALVPPIEATRSVTGAGQRHLIWLHFLAAIIERPWTGYGINQGVAALATIADPGRTSENVSFAHNLLLDLVTWFGLPIAAAMAAALAAWIMSWLRPSPDRQLSFDRAAVCAIWVALLVQSMLEFPYAHTFFLLPAAVLAGAVAAPVSAGAEFASRRTNRVAGMGFLAFGVIAATTFLLLCLDYFKAEADFRQNRLVMANVGGTAQPIARSELMILDQLAALNASAAIRFDSSIGQEDVEAQRRLARRFNMLSVRFAYAQALHASGDPSLAEDEIRLLKGVYDKKRYRQIERSWADWKTQRNVPLPQ